MRAKVLFITQDSAYPQMGVLYLADALSKADIDCEMLSSGVSREALDTTIEHYRPDVVGMSVMTAPEVTDFERHSVHIKETYPGIKVVWGGVHPTLLSGACLLSNYIDYVFVGQGEEVFPELVIDIANGGDRFPRKVSGHSPARLNDFAPVWDKVDVSRYLFSERHSVRSPDVRIKHLVRDVSRELKNIVGDNVEALDDHETRTILQDIKKWDVGLYDTDKNIFYYLLTSRGCPYKCTFCSEPLQVMHGDVTGKFLWNAHDLEWVKRQIEAVRAGLADSGEKLDGVGIWDDMFWVNHRRDTRAKDILSYFKDEGLGYLIEARADQLLRDDFALFKFLGDTGCIQVFVGAESASQETLNYMRKGTRVRDYEKLMRYANEVHVALRMSFIVGFPNETDASINETLNYCESIEGGEFGPWVNVSGPKIFTPYPGTVEYDRAVEAGFRPPASHVEWGRIHRSTEEYLEQFPWFLKTCSDNTLARLEKHFGKGYKVLAAH
jgi:anaerobic magnesium-protoporphyrin IX monomethyl ester cyclase